MVAWPAGFTHQILRPKTPLGRILQTTTKMGVYCLVLRCVEFAVGADSTMERSCLFFVQDSYDHWRGTAISKSERESKGFTAHSADGGRARASIQVCPSSCGGLRADPFPSVSLLDHNIVANACLSILFPSGLHSCPYKEMWGASHQTCLQSTRPGRFMRFAWSISLETKPQNRQF
jgi:hypothetical protein